MIEYYLAGGGLRLTEIVINASLWIVIGCFISAVFRRMLGAERVKRIFANETRWGLLAGWFIGMLLPVCSLGVIPIVRELHRVGVKRGTIVAFGLTAPLFNPMSVLYGLTMSDPLAILTFSLCALFIVSFLGLVWGRIGSPAQVDSDAVEPMPVYGIKRSVSVFYSASKELAGPSLLYVAIGITASVVLAVMFGKGYLQDQVEVENPLAPVVVALVATPVYSTPFLAMSQIGSMFSHGNSIGAAFSLLILGAGTNIGLFVWFGRAYGLSRVILFYVMLFGTTVGLAYLIDKPLYPKGVDPAGHTHAFDVYTHPFEPTQPKMAELAQNEALEFWKEREFGGTYLMLLLIIMGLGFRVADKSFDFEAWFVESDEKEKKVDTILPGWFLGMTIVVGLIIGSVIGCYLYYPPPDDLLKDLMAINTEAVLTSKNERWEAAEKWVEYADNLSRRLEVGVYLRQGHVEEFKTTKARIYRDKLDVLRHAVEERRSGTVDKVAMDVSNAYRRMSAAFRDR